MDSKKIVLNLEYEKETVNSKGNKYTGGVKKPEYIDELFIDVFENYAFNNAIDDFTPDGKYNIEIKGSERALFELGKYFINISQFITKDKNFHEHIDDICDADGNNAFNLTIVKDHS